jgi:hypothetical protein
MTQRTCTCGYEAEDDMDLVVHFGEMFTPADDVAPDGQVHTENARDAATAGAGALSCRCGFTSPVSDFDQHLADVFTPADRIGQDGKYHAASGEPN